MRLLLNKEGQLLLGSTTGAAEASELGLIQNQLAQCRSAYEQGDVKTLQQALKEFIHHCDKILTKFPSDQVQQRLAQPHFQTVLALQKCAVSDALLVSEVANTQPSKQVRTVNAGKYNIAHARWQLLKNILEPTQSQLAPLKPDYFQEYRHKGITSIAEWLEDVPPVSLRTLSYNEVKKKDELSPTKYVQYERDVNDFKITIEKLTGALYYPDGTLVDSTAATSAHTNDHLVIYAMDADGNLFASLADEDLPFSFHHSTLAGGKPVICAGDMLVKNGQIVEISNFSGHYKPSKKQMLNLLQNLEEQGVKLENVTLMMKGNKMPINAQRYLTMKGYAMLDQYLAAAKSISHYNQRQTFVAKNIDGLKDEASHQIKSALVALSKDDYLTPWSRLVKMQGALLSLAAKDPEGPFQVEADKLRSEIGAISKLAHKDSCKIDYLSEFET